MKILQPDYYENFKCIGGKCTHTCCQGWTIWIDKKSFNKYKKIDGDFGKKMKKSIRKNRIRKNENEYGIFNITESGKCSLLNEKNLCELYINKGENYLCRTCKVHPRLVNRYINDMIERNLQITCPVVIKNLILNNKPFEFILKEDKLTEIDKAAMVTWHGINNKLYRLLWEARSLFISIIQDNNIEMLNALMLIKMTEEKIDQIIENNKFLNPDFDIECIYATIENEENINFLNKLNINNSIIIKFNAIGNVLKEINIGEQCNTECLGLVSALFDFIYTNCNGDEEKIRLKCIEFENYFINKNYIIENFIVSYLYANYLDATEDFSFDIVIYMLIFSVGVIKSILMIIWNKNKEISENDFIDVIHWTYINICLHKNYIYEILNIKKYNTLAYAYIFAK